MLELVVALVSLVIFAFIIYSTYSARSAKFLQRKKAFELKEAHMTKSMDMIRSEISLIDSEIKKIELRFSDLEATSD